MKKVLAAIMVLAAILCATAAMAAAWVDIGYTEDGKHIFIDKDSIKNTEKDGVKYADVTLKCNYKDGAHDIATLRLSETPKQFGVLYVVRYNWKGGTISEDTIQEADVTMQDLPESTCGDAICTVVFQN